MRHVTRTTLAGLTVALLVLAVGCSGDDSEEIVAGASGETTTTLGGSSPGNAGSGTVGSSVPQTDPGGPVQWTRIEPTDDLVNPIVATPDELVVDPDDDQTVLVHFYGGVQECYGARATVVDEDDASVTIRVEVGSRADAGDRGCIEIAEAQELAVHLDAPVGDRELVAATN
jgi:hypothetical protein